MSIAGELDKIQTAIMEAEGAEKGLAEITLPRVTATVQDVFTAFCDVTGTGTFDVSRREQFLFIALYLLCPLGLFARKLPHGMRRELARVMGLTSPTVISDARKNLLFRFRHYHQATIESLLPCIADRLQKPEQANSG